MTQGRDGVVDRDARALKQRRVEVQRVLAQTIELRTRAIAAAQDAEAKIHQLQGQLMLLTDLLAPKPNESAKPPGKG